jgi:long-subunit acyl-CoA synthetase (AMP-forming)
MFDFACAMASLVSVGFPGDSDAGTIGKLLAHIQPACVVVDASTAHFVSQALAASGVCPLVVWDGTDTALYSHLSRTQGTTTTEELLDVSAPISSGRGRGPDALATLVLTSGSSGVPKAAMMTDAIWAARMDKRPGMALTDAA